jgi:hypothetical protein
MTVSFLNCPSRGSLVLHPFGENTNSELRNINRVLASQRVDYVANDGGTYPIDDTGGPATLAQGLAGQGFNPQMDRKHVSGISFPRSEIAAKDVTDGLSHTYLVGEKALDANLYSLDAYDPNRRQLPYGAGHRATAFWPPMRDPVGLEPNSNALIFGSAHADGLRMSYCDGSVRTVSYDIDAETHRRLASRHDGWVAPSDL